MNKISIVLIALISGVASGSITSFLLHQNNQEIAVVGLSEKAQRTLDMAKDEYHKAVSINYAIKTAASAEKLKEKERIYKGMADAAVSAFVKESKRLVDEGIANVVVSKDNVINARDDIFYLME